MVGEEEEEDNANANIVGSLRNEYDSLSQGRPGVARSECRQGTRILIVAKVSNAFTVTLQLNDHQLS